MLVQLTPFWMPTQTTPYALSGRFLLAISFACLGVAFELLAIGLDASEGHIDVDLGSFV